MLTIFMYLSWILFICCFFLYCNFGLFIDLVELEWVREKTFIFIVFCFFFIFHVYFQFYFLFVCLVYFVYLVWILIKHYNFYTILNLIGKSSKHLCKNPEVIYHFITQFNKILMFVVSFLCGSISKCQGKHMLPPSIRIKYWST